MPSQTLSSSRMCFAVKIQWSRILEVPGGGIYQNLLQESIEVPLGDNASIQFVDLDALIRLKNAAGRGRDLEAVAELLRIKEERKRIS
jgi:hypothetical protein